MCLRSWKIYSIQLVVYYTFNIARTKGSYWKKICRITMTKNALEVNFFHVPHGYFLGRKSSLCVSRQEEFGTLVGICTSQGVSMILRVSQVSTWLFSEVAHWDLISHSYVCTDYQNRQCRHHFTHTGVIRAYCQLLNYGKLP